MEKKKLAIGTLLDKMQRYCAYQERCIYDVRKKLSAYDVSQRDEEWIIDMLIDDKFIDEERFTRCYVRSKVASYWGIIRIENELKLRKIPRDIIERAIGEINEEEYRERFEKLADEKIKSTGGIDSLKQKARVYNYLASRGYESSMIMDFLSVK